MRTKIFKKHGTSILSFAAIVGVVATGIAAAKASKKVEEKRPKRIRMTKMEYIREYWKDYIPTVIIGGATCACIASANHISKKQQAALVAACVAAGERFSDYREKTKEIFGEEADTKIQNSIVKDKMEAVEDLDRPEGEELLFFDRYSDRYFNATMDHVLEAEYHFNRNLQLRDYAVVNEFYEFLGIGPDPNGRGDDVGWNTWSEATYGYKWVDFYHDKVVMDDGLECYIISMPFEPHADFME